MAKAKLHIYYDPDADYLELTFGKPKPSFYEKIAPDTFVRIDRHNKKPSGYAIFNVRKHAGKLRSLVVDIPDYTVIVSQPKATKARPAKIDAQDMQ